MMKETARIADELRRAHKSDAWHGASVSEVLEHVSASEAAARPIAGAHTIWELVLHVTAWREEARHRLERGWHAEPDRGDWPPVTDTSEQAWQAALADLAAATEALVAAVERFPEERLDERIGRDRDPAAGTGLSFATTLHGVAQHDAYHAGQIVIVKKALLSPEGGLRH
jgi:uncharacterized damage-inducible protein DinB